MRVVEAVVSSVCVLTLAVALLVLVLVRCSRRICRGQCYLVADDRHVVVMSRLYAVCERLLWLIGMPRNVGQHRSPHIPYVHAAPRRWRSELRVGDGRVGNFLCPDSSFPLQLEPEATFESQFCCTPSSNQKLHLRAGFILRTDVLVRII